MGVGHFCHPRLLAPDINQEEINDTGRDVQPHRWDGLEKLRQPLLVVRCDLFQMHAVGHGGHPCHNCRIIHVQRHSHPV